MRDALAWSFPLGRLFGIKINVHLLFPLLVLGLIFRAAWHKGYPDEVIPDGRWIDATIVLAFLFLSVLLHELGHCFGARWVQGDAQQVLLWPLGGLAYVDVPHTPRANFLATAAGPAVNLVLCLVCGLLLLITGPQPIQPPWSPFGYPGRGVDGLVALTAWDGSAVHLSPYSLSVLLSWLFFVNWLQALFNLLLPGYPLDGGRLLQAALWPYLGYRRATRTAVFFGFGTVFVIAIFAIATQEVLAMFLALFIYSACQHQWIVLETGGEESLFGYDFSQGYTSLEREDEEERASSTRTRPRQSWWQQWRQRRLARKMQREQERREADELRMDELLEKISSQGISALTEEEKRFMKQFSDRYRNK
jgi:Zn-dependent protease